MQNGKTYIAQLPARVVRHDRLNGTPALVLTAPAYPEGGLNGGHLIILWNTRGHGYFISLHFDVSPTGAGYSESERLLTAIAVAKAAAPSGDMPARWRSRTRPRWVTAVATGVFLPRVWWMRMHDELRHSPCHPQLVLATLGKPIQPAASGHETPILKLPQRGKERTVTRLPGKSGSAWVTLHQSEQPRLEHAPA
jgi:hypothetical protein